MPMTLRWQGATSLAVEAECLSPETMMMLSAVEAARLPVWLGNASAEVGDLFRVEGTAEDGRLVLEGDISHVRRIGQGMGSGSVSIRGDVGSHLGSGMTGGTIEVEGKVGDWAGAEMRGGRITIRGEAGNHLGGAYPGSRQGMRDGLILVEGDIGNDAGLAMRRGLIAVSGGSGDDLGRAMIAGSIFAFGTLGARVGAGMRRGTLALFGVPDPADPGLLPTFAASGRYRPPVLTIYLKRLREWGFPVPDTAFSGTFVRYNGDLIEHGQGEVLVRS
jgi:formylmethanofuran dehydrogenase subunit C